MKEKISPSGAPSQQIRATSSDRIDCCRIAFARGPDALAGESKKMRWQGVFALRFFEPPSGEPTTLPAPRFEEIRLAIRCDSNNSPWYRTTGSSLKFAGLARHSNY